MVILINSSLRCFTFKKLFDIELVKEIAEWKDSGFKFAKEKIL
jgi:hypothetical protein